MKVSRKQLGGRACAMLFAVGTGDGGFGLRRTAALVSGDDPGPAARRPSAALNLAPIACVSPGTIVVGAYPDREGTYLLYSHSPKLSI